MRVTLRLMAYILTKALWPAVRIIASSSFFSFLFGGGGGGGGIQCLFL